MGRTPLAYSAESTAVLPIKDPHSQNYRNCSDNNSSRYSKWVPWLVPAIIVANIIIFIVTMYVNNCPAHYDEADCLAARELGPFAFQSTHENPLLGPSSTTLLAMGAMEVKKVVEQHQVWRLVSCMWLHAGVIHIFANMLSLLFVGIRLEEEFGFGRIGLLYVISGMGGSLSSALFVRDNISVGASGALFGLLGGMLSELFVNWTIYENKVESLVSLVIIILINMAVGILPHVDNFAHLGGFSTGFLLGFVLLIRPQFGWVKNFNNNNSKPKYKAYQCFLLIIAAIILIAGFTVGLLLLLRGVDGNNHCSWCHYLSCVPTPLWSCDARCMSIQFNNQLNLTCVTTHRSQIFMLDDAVNNTARIQNLCVELCR
ncbi:RHOMBOID-like protein 2 [Andrographis paniculata]|uniref:RHOMBOID-like protein 2 n=1 Tax=Andrographis paniculata TaxID=175694 RepID=UPI0021E8776C|nr:RHOMBOID-like protein 2 [Andrographis paniculata]